MKSDNSEARILNYPNKYKSTRNDNKSMDGEYGESNAKSSISGVE
jgi:hypothetical protein